MARPKTPVRRRIWRVTPEAPMGEFVELDAAGVKTDEPLPERDARAESGEANWVQSSFDLAIGLEVSDFEDTVPAELLDALDKTSPPPRK